MTALYLVFVFTLVNVLKDTAGTVCSDAVTDGTAVLNMCEDGNAVGDHVVIDTYGSSVYRKDGGSINCSCTATLTGLPDGTSTTVGYGPVQSLYPPTGCGSSVIVSTQRAASSRVSTRTHLCTITNRFYVTLTNDTITVVWQSGVSGSTSGYCLLLRTVVSSRSLSTRCFTISSQRETTTQSKESTAQSRETTTTTKSSLTTTHSIKTTSYKGTNSGATTERQNCVHQNNLQLCYPLTAVVAPQVVTSLLITITVVIHFILYRKRLAIVKKAENTGTAMTSPNSVDYDSLDLSRVEPPNVYSDTSTGHMYINTAMES